MWGPWGWEVLYLIGAVGKEDGGILTTRKKIGLMVDYCTYEKGLLATIQELPEGNKTKEKLFITKIRLTTQGKREISKIRKSKQRKLPLKKKRTSS